jgi:hypothetical protein
MRVRHSGISGSLSLSIGIILVCILPWTDHPLKLCMVISCAALVLMLYRLL